MRLVREFRMSPVLLAMAVALTVHAQSAPSTPCRWLTAAEAAEVIGADVTLQMAVQDGACVYRNGPLRLQIAQPAWLVDTRALRLGYDSMKKDRQGQDVPGIGEEAFVAGNRREIAFLKNQAFVVVTIEGEGGDRHLAALKDAARKIADRF
ncbi:MAG: hypothetical protein R2712_25775 [Vicinamibacterales bacterium]